jgi:hypothetical protein
MYLTPPHRTAPQLSTRDLRSPAVSGWYKDTTSSGMESEVYLKNCEFRDTV